MLMFSSSGTAFVPRLALALCLFAAVSGCSDGVARTAPASAAETPIEVVAQDVIVLRREQSASATVISGTIHPARRADLRAETAGQVLQVLRENGEAVRKGELLVRLDDTALRDDGLSAEAAARAAGQALDQAERQLQRLKRLRGIGLAALQEVEDAENRRADAQAALAAAQARAAQARQQLQRTEVRAPFDGIVSERKVSPGDTAAVGKELVKVLDPSSVRLEGLVAAERALAVQVGQPVRLRVGGAAGPELHGRVSRIDPAASAATRQVAVQVQFDSPAAAPSAGLYAQGRIDTDAVAALSIRASALVREGARAYAWRVRDGVLQKQPVELGAFDERYGRYAVRAGLHEGDVVIRRPGRALAVGRKVRLAAAPGA